MKKSFLVLAMLLMFGGSMFAQDLDLGVKIGYQTPKLSYKQANIKSDFMNHMTFGLFGRIEFGNLYIQPEVMYFKTLEDVKKQTNIQQKLLFEAAKHLKKEGILIYATCALSKAEGEEQVKQFLAQHPDFALLPLSTTLFQIYPAKKLDEGIIDKQVLRTLPYHNKNDGGADGFFAAALVRIQ